MSKYVFFTVNDFSKAGGGPIRMLGVLNALAKRGNQVTLFSNAEDHVKLPAGVENIFLNCHFSPADKRKFQALLSVAPVGIVNMVFNRQLSQISAVLNQVSENSEIIFFEYLDNSIGYWLFKNRVIDSYVNDIHGVATLEFSFQAQKANRLIDRLKFKLKYWSSTHLDKKVFGYARGFIFASNKMKEYFQNKYSKANSAKKIVLPYVLSEVPDSHVDPSLFNKIKAELPLSHEEKVILFAGSFKKTGGISDLILAFKKVLPDYPYLKLLLVGDGPTMSECRDLVKSLELEDKVIFTGRTPYEHLPAYQKVANIIVCPDKQNDYSEMIVHVKYLDALASGKIVINGSFASVREINPNDELSISFRPSDVSDLSEKIKYCLLNEEKLKEKYQRNVDHVRTHLTYEQFIHVLESH